MILVAYIILIFTIIQMLVALMNLLPGTYLPSVESNPSDLISVLIPARNEEENIGNILDDLVRQDYPDIEILVFDDQSEDRTGDIVKEFCLRDQRIRLICSEGLPEGWLGKNHACHSLAGYSKGAYMLFIDADVRIRDNTIGKAISVSKKHDLSLISIFPEQAILSTGEKITVPNMNYILLSLLPLLLVRKSKFPSLSAANGQFMFFRADTYRSIEPHRLMKNNKVEDISIARHMKKNGLKIACLVGDKNITCRMYPGFRDAINGFSKNVTAFFGNSFLLAVIFWLITTFGFLAIIFHLPESMIIVYLTAYLLTRIFISISSRQNIFFNLFFIIPLQFSMGIFIYKAILNKLFRKYLWKGRSIE